MLETDQKPYIQMVLNVILLQVNALALDQYGCRVLQKAIETMPSQFQIQIIS